MDIKVMPPDYRARKQGKQTIPIEQRLYNHIEINQETGCWEWTGTKRNGYGRLIVGSRTDGTRHSVSAHRLSYELFCGPIPDGMEVCHKCDNRCCINPDHLFVGTHQDNIDDRELKGRNVVYKGEDQVNSKLTEQDVIDARKERINNKTPYKVLADKYGVCKKTIMNAINGVTWKHVEYLLDEQLPAPPEDN